MKHVFAVLTALALLGFAVPGFACDGSKKAKKADEATMTSAETSVEAEKTTSASDGDQDKKVKTQKVVKKEGEV